MLTLLLACAVPEADPPAPRAVALTWYRSEEAESWELALAGLDWALSQAGATPPLDGSALEVREQRADRVAFTHHLDRLDLPGEAEALLAEVGAELDAAEGSGNDDLGRFLLRSLHEPWRYYALTGACPTLEEWRAGRPPLPLEYAVTTSLLVPEERLIRLPAAQEGRDDVAFEAVEGAGSLLDGSFAPTSYETVDLMPNGQFRYAVYSLAGELLPTGESEETGMPGKCAWCHEASVHAGTANNASAPGYLTYTEWMQHREAAQAEVERLRASLDTTVPYATPAVHGDAERLVEGFLTPDTARVANEWESSEEAVLGVLGPGTVDVDEFGWTGRYTREEVDAAAPDPGALPTLQSARDLPDGAGLAPAPTPMCR